MIHATAMAVAAISLRLKGPASIAIEELRAEGVPEDCRACAVETKAFAATGQTFPLADAIDLLEGRNPYRLPTCSECRVLIDMALEHPRGRS